MSRGRNVGVFLALSAIWGLSFPAISAGLDSIPPLLFAAARFLIGGTLLLAYLVATGADWRPRTRADVAAISVAGAFVIGIGNGLLFVGQLSVPGGIASILYGLIPILTTGFAAALLPSEPITPKRLVGVATGLLGVGVIARPDPSNLFAAEVVGIGFVVGAAVSVAFGSVLLRRYSPTLGIGTMTAWAMLAGGGLLYVGGLLLGERLADTTPTVVGVASVLYLAVFASAVAYVIYFVLLEELGALEINLVSYVVPVFATAGGIALLGEELSAGMIGGFVLIAAGFVVLKARVIATELGY